MTFWFSRKINDKKRYCSKSVHFWTWVILLAGFAVAWFSIDGSKIDNLQVVCLFLFFGGAWFMFFGFYVINEH